MTELALLLVRLVLAVVFLIAGLAKFASREEAMQAVRDLGAPRVVQPLGVALPPLEIAVAIAFFFAASAWYAACVALALLALFIATIAANLARGRQPDCNCFGQLTATPISWRTLARNFALAAGATWLIVSGPPNAAADLWVFLSGLDTRGRRIAMAAAGVIGFLLLSVLKKDEPEDELNDDREPDPPSLEHSQPAVGRKRTLNDVTPNAPDVDRTVPAKLLSGDGLAVGTTAPDFTAPDLTGHLHSLESLRAGGVPLLICFSSPGCQACQRLMPKLPGLVAQHEQTLRIVLISRGRVQENLAKLKDPGTMTVLLQTNYEIAEAYNCTSSPAAVVISADGTVQSPLALGPQDIEQLIASNA